MTLKDVRWISVPHRTDQRGVLTALEGPTVPVEVKRVFFIHRVPAGAERGRHAHLHTEQLVVAVSGRLRFDVYDGADTRSYLVDDPHMALYIPRMIWMRLYDFSADAVAMVLCNTTYVPDDVIRDLGQYRERLGALRR